MGKVSKLLFNSDMYIVQKAFSFTSALVIKLSAGTSCLPCNRYMTVYVLQFPFTAVASIT